MKDNVDLTINRDFRKPVNLKGLKRYFDKKIRNIKFPWNVENNLLTTLDTSELFFTRDKIRRQRKKDSVKYDQGLECECCGKDLSKQPWNDYYRLCPRCYNNLEKNYKSKFPWKKI